MTTPPTNLRERQDAATVRMHRLLVVDNEENVAFTLSEILRQEGIEVDTALSGEEALERIRETEYDVVLSDLRMDDVDGVSVIGEARRRSPSTATIILTGFASLESAIAAMREGAYDYLIKPCVIEDLKNTVRRGLERRSLTIQVEGARARLEEINRDLEQRIEHKTAELQRANEELREAARAKDVFFASLSHELRTPLTPILGWVRVLRSPKATLEIRDQGLEVIERNANLQIRLIDDLLDVARIASGKLDIDLQPIDLASVIANAVETVRDKASEDRIELSVESDQVPSLVMGSDVRLQQIVWNLLSNAIKFSEPESRVRLKLERDEGVARITVSDNGAGIPPEFLPEIFEPFSQSRTGTNSKSKSGMGLGLAIASRLAEAHGGRLRAESAGSGQGATFSLELPLLEQSESEGEGRGPSDRNQAAAGPVLLVEEPGEVADRLGQALESRGLRVIKAGAAGKALEAMDAETPQLVIASTELDDMDGYEFLSRLRRKAKLRNVPVIAISGRADESDFSRARAAGFAAYITKPLESERLLVVVDAIASRQRVTG